MRDLKAQFTMEEMEKAEMRTSKDLNTKYTLDELPKGKAKPITITPTHNHRYVTHTKHALTFREARFIDAYMKYADGEKAVEEAGYTCKNKAGKAKNLLSKDYIIDEIGYRNEIYASQLIADRDEVMQYFTAVMRGEIKDQFNLDAPLSERTNAAKELARRLIDVPDKASIQAQQNNITIQLNWDRQEEIVEAE